MFRSMSGMALVLLAAAFLATGTRAQGIIVPIPCDVRPCIPRPVRQPVPNVLPIKSINIEVKIEGQIATTHVEQVFRNDTAITLEGTYFFPIPEQASITEFAIWENDKRLVGEVRSRDEARRIYDEIVRRQRDPGLLEYAGKDLFQASIFPIPPNSDKKLELTYSQVLRADSDTIGYRYPLGTGQSLVQSQAESRGRQKDQKFGTISGRIDIKARGTIRNIYSPSHSLDVDAKAAGHVVVSFATRNIDSDLQLFYSLSNDEVGMSLLTYREPGKDGYFLLILSPRDLDAAVASKDIVFVLDTSGSMADEGKMEKARKALLFGIRTLRDDDRFNLISFSGEEHLMSRGLISADSAGKKRGEEFVNRLQPSGGTNINDALVAAVKQFDRSDRPKMLVFMTDGLPTVGERGEDRILTNLRKAKDQDLRIFPFGFGYDVNTALLDRIGSENAGVSDYVQPREDLEVKVSSFFSKVSSPVLSEIELDTAQLIADQVYPRKLPDLFKGMQLTVIGRYRNTNDLQDIAVKLSGRAGKAVRTFSHSGLDFPLTAQTNDFLPRLWAARRVGWLIEQVRVNGESKEVRDEIVDLGTRYGLVTPYTSYLATDGSFVNARRDAPMATDLGREAKAMVAERSGARAVELSVRQNSMQAAAGLDEDKDDRSRQVAIRNSAENRFIAQKSFIKQSNVWIDDDFSDGLRLPEVTIRFASDEYFALVRAEPGIAPYLSLGQNVVVVWKGKIYRVVV